MARRGLREREDLGADGARLRRARAALLLLLLGGAASASAAERKDALPPPPRGRWHHELPGRARWSVLFRRTEAGDETRLLVETKAGRWVLLSTQPASGRSTREDVFSTRLGEGVSRLLSHTPAAGTPECARVAPPDACVVLEGSRGRLAAPLSAFSGEDAAPLRKRAAAVVSPAFLADLRGLAPALPIADLAFYAEDFLALLDPALARPPGPDLAPPRLPGCAFDATFGWPCDADEARREAWLFRQAKPAATPAAPTPAPGGAPDGGGRGRS